MTVDEILNEKLRPREGDAGGEWRLWEHKSLNMHRGVLCWRPGGIVAACADLARAVRDQVAARYKISWWRGFAFGALVELSEAPRDLASVEACIDTRNQSKGTWRRRTGRSSPTTSRWGSRPEVSRRRRTG